jgi:hypothetical protein
MERISIKIDLNYPLVRVGGVLYINDIRN